MLTSVDKMWAALLTSGFGFAGMLWPELRENVGEETIAAATTILTTLTVWLVPNKGSGR